MVENILLGNGFSRNFSDNFSQVDNKAHELSFQDSRDQPYETYLWSKYFKQAVLAVHPKYSAVKEKLEQSGKRLKGYDNIFTTNYDLLLYWMVNQNQVHFRDFFCSGSFVDEPESWLSEMGKSFLFHLHGALYLKKADERNKESKVKATGDLSILEQVDPQDMLFVTASNADAKQQQITESEYLNFCTAQFEQLSGKLEILGFGFNDNDQHIINAINQNKRIDQIEVYCFNKTQKDIAIKKLQNQAEIRYSSHERHPLIEALQLQPANAI